ncbi:MAG: tetraether lipid synthase Tes [Acidobacteriota bacterium]
MSYRFSSVTPQEAIFERAMQGLPRKTDSLCPECLEVIEACIFEEDGKVIMEKRCGKHGSCRDIVYSDAQLYRKIEKWSFFEGEGIANPKVQDATLCPWSCGLCQMHYSTPALTNIDLTNRCNLRCRFCFANANATDYVYEPGLDQIKRMLEQAISVRPRREQAVQFSGGEPSLSPHFIEACRYARTLGYARIQAATNGIIFAQNFEFVEKAREAGLDTLYLQFDGTDEKIYRETRGVNLWEIKQKCIETSRKLNIAVVLVPTIVKTINDDQIGKILQFGINNVDVIPGISYQPVCFTGRIDQHLRMQQRFTLSDLAWAVEKQTGYASAMRDWYPIAMINPLTRVMDSFKKGDVKNMFCSCHTNCGIGTFLFVNRATKEVIPFPKIFDIEKAALDMVRLAEKMERKPSKLYATLCIINLFRKHFLSQKDTDFNLFTFLKIMDHYAGGQLGIAKRDKYQWRMIYCAGMHFQDAFNYNVERVKRCVIHYSSPDGKMYPFCTYNSGPYFREKIERQFSIPKEDWIRMKGSSFVSEGFFGEAP